MNVQEKESFLPKLGLPFLMCQLELVHVPVCDFFVCVCISLVCLVELVFICLYFYLYILEEESALTKWEVPFLLCQLELH